LYLNRSCQGITRALKQSKTELLSFSATRFSQHFAGAASIPEDCVLSGTVFKPRTLLLLQKPIPAANIERLVPST
jgi:hypothetical protein